jgi:hypothetical protein
MPNLPVRDLGGSGIVSDLHPFDLPPNALSAGVNVRFDNRKITRAPVHREVYQFPSDFDPAYLFSIPPVTEGNDAIVAVGDTGSIYTVTGGPTLTDVSPPDPHVITTDTPWSHSFLGSIAYLNQKDGVPLMKGQGDATFLPLTAWPSTYRCLAMRGYKDFLIALGVSKGGTEYPTMVKWSDFATFGAPPQTWDTTETTNSSGENIINEMRTPIVDGMTLRDSFVIYCQNEVWIMDYIGGNFMFRFRKLYDRAGSINLNCVVQVDGMHYVFDQNDIYAHDGATKTSIAQGKVKDFIFDNLDFSKRRLCFVSHDPILSEIHFNYPSTDDRTGFAGATTGCNRQAVYHYPSGRWTFYDAPNVTAVGYGTLPQGDPYSSFSALTFADVASEDFQVPDQVQRSYTLFASRKDASLGITQSRITGLDRMVGGGLSAPVCTEALKPCVAERVGLDLDELEVPLPGYKVIHTLYPQLGIKGGDPVSFQFGATDVVEAEVAFGDALTFDPSASTKVDTGRVAGRYLAWRMTYTGSGDFSFSGFDANVVARGRRG